ncbi:phosphoesterase RecJ-like protein [Scopulibacillus darangshiensis]|uniref:Phosphoesterase RecJ-like protein n=1 Tax=Scopulibacillus darangshiensis TaxID=442528 RepID=A0A4R2PDB2_9BACL|nr:bifunctional oligoribonuclease/PAP phosphatase NrnA [Scopulibacillus darangshiensis]TCP32081.1 phosphoesterase RecJ-like protein [Scopulibacillus darangshiensis]
MIEKIIEAIEAYETIIIHRHVRPDPDALGSQGGVACFIRDNFPGKSIYLVGEDVPSLTFLNRMDVIEDRVYEGALVIVCDTANQARISDQRYNLGEKLIKIDHHPNEDPYGDMMWVNTGASSVSEMIVSIFESRPEFTMSDEAARLLYAGIVGDTGRFLFSNTTNETFNRASLLIKKNFNRQELYDRLYQANLNLTRLNGYVLQHFELSDEGAGYMTITQDLMDTYSVKPEDASLLVNAFSNVENIKAWVFFIEEKDQIRVRLRSKGPVVNTLAAKYNGGGHPMASGATVYTWEETEQVLADLKEACRKYQ